jgi:hypothetical protein
LKAGKSGFHAVAILEDAVHRSAIALSNTWPFRPMLIFTLASFKVAV